MHLHLSRLHHFSPAWSIHTSGLAACKLLVAVHPRGNIVTTLSNLKSSATAIDGEQAVAAVAGGWCMQDKRSSVAQVFHAGFCTGVIACDSWPKHKLKHMQATMLTDGSCDVAPVMPL